jgi:hypothetical protein
LPFRESGNASIEAVTTFPKRLCAAASSARLQTSWFTDYKLPGSLITNFLVHYRPLADSWTLFDNSAAALSIFAAEERDELQLIETKQYTELVTRYGKA